VTETDMVIERHRTEIELLKIQPDRGIKEIWERYAGLVYAIVKNRLRGFAEQDMEECVSDIFLRVYETREALDCRRGSMRAYICTVAKGVAIDAARRLYARDKKHDGLGKAVHVTSGEDAEQKLLSKEESRRLRDAIWALGQPDARIITEKYILGKKSAKIGAGIGMTANTVDQRARRALKKLSNILEGQEYE
jgi:RNA polymerase sigma-70 factor (ECF subfamily)